MAVISHGVVSEHRYIDEPPLDQHPIQTLVSARPIPNLKELDLFRVETFRLGLGGVAAGCG